MSRELSESERVEREEFARGHVGPGEEPVEPRPAATTVLARPPEPGPRHGLEVLLLRRPETARFAAGAYVFPGGVIDPADATEELADRFGPRVTSAERPALVAALREGFEETGLLPADAPPGPDELERLRRALLTGERDFPSVVRELDLDFRGLRAAYFARWITPARLARRYDARFFLVEHRGGEPRFEPDEHTEALWLDPGTALGRFEAGGFPLLFPTRKTLEELAGFEDLDAAFRSYRDRRVTPVQPRLLIEGEEVIPLLPDDPRYEDAAP